MGERTLVDDLNGAGFETVLSGVNHERHPRTDRYALDLNWDWDDWRCDRAVDHAIDFLRQRSRSAKPFFLNIGTQEPHRSTWHHYAPDPAAREQLPPGFPTDDASVADFGRFLSARAAMDAAFGRLMALLDGTGLIEETLVVMTTDHGIHGPRAKGTLYELGTEIALVIRHPGAPPAQRQDLISNIDFRPSFLELLGLDVPKAIDGHSFASAVLAPEATPTRRTPVFTERNFHGEPLPEQPGVHRSVYRPMRSIRTPDYRLIWNLPHPTDPAISNDQEWELYALNTDPAETENLSGLPEFRSSECDLRTQLQDWMQTSRDFAPGQPPPPHEPPGWGPNWCPNR